jgi:putative redox protein
VNADGAYVISRQVTMDGDLDAEQRQRLLEIADKCPVHKTLSGSITIKTTAGTG